MDEHRGEMARWLDVLAAKGVLELVFVNRPWPIDLRLPTTLFSCASLTRLYLGLWRLPDTAAVPRRANFPKLRELGLCFNVMQDRDLAFMLERSPALEILVITANQTGLRLRLVSHSVRCVELGCAYLDDIVMVDAPRLERLFQWTTFGDLSEGNPNICQHSRIQIGHAPNLRVLGYLQPRENEMEITNTVVVAGTKDNIVPSVQVFAMEVPFGVRNAVKKSEKCDEPSGKVNLKFWQEGGPIKCVLSMKKVFFYEFRGSRSEVAFLKFIAERARVLEKMVAGECLSSGDNVNAKLKPLTGAKWMNKACKLELFKSPYPEVASPVFCHELASDFSFPDPFDLGYYTESL
ncbi:hypothetical protein ACQ4PT_032691 [Festuca glaucescens]